MPDPDSHLQHGALEFPTFKIETYSLAVRDDNGFVGDNASRPAFQSILQAWRTLFETLHGKDPLGDKPSEEIPKWRLDELMQKEGPAAAAIQGALEDYAEQLGRVIRRFLNQESWKGVQRVIIGGGLKQSDIGALAIEAVAKRLFQDDVHIQLRLLHHHADEGGLIGWLHLMPPDLAQRYRAMLAVDIGGTNIRCGIVRVPKNRNPRKAKVVIAEKWSHARDDDATRKEHVVQGIADMLKKQIAYAKKKGIKLAPWVGVACPGRIRQDGSISRGTQNLPGDWAHPDFHLPRALCKRLPRIDGQQTQVMLHNDAVVQGLSELPYLDDIRRWAVLTVGTGVGNACYTIRGNRGEEPIEKTGKGKSKKAKAKKLKAIKPAFRTVSTQDQTPDQPTSEEPTTTQAPTQATSPKKAATKTARKTSPAKTATTKTARKSPAKKATSKAVRKTAAKKAASKNTRKIQP
ncbi:MAG TPA: ROK family protein [Bordetella sp.]|nr:ROK family protein [Bordetella sp.]